MMQKHIGERRSIVNGKTISKENEVERFDEIRYCYEHRFLPGYFYKNREALAKMILEDGDDFPYRTMDILYEEEGQEMRYTREQYKVYPCMKGKEYSLICIEMPEPERECLCYQIYLVFSNDYQYGNYFMVERVALQIQDFCARGI